ncbi:phage tail protein [Enterobacter asburiae]|uniref:phage tail protein n=1 Tax=Enterobacter cloacae complex TaxID=354276 RepID=UPI000BA0F4BA|nr:MULTISPECIES: phage tail protein [Enterobacter cloacae complex]QBB06374.1 phage tail protein [Enterobacter cloacae]EKX8898741.1 phage tail protein [Enterobacter asburiae]MCE1344612.1 phage tail protein [Enterobacter asburiae]MCO7414691.1 phage tail protein [Enterobacter asburiae]OZP65751.1 phage tail protein [Enterobacter asburiae]
MATNNFKAFALDPNANVTSQADWEALPALLSGFTAGKASSAQVNKAIRQATTIAALVGQFIANSGADALDNADVNGLVTKFTNALIANLRLGAGAPAIGIPFFWPSSAMPNTVMTEWADMVFLKFNGATFSAATYPKLALVFPGLTLTEARGEFLRIWDDGRGVDSGRTLLSAQSDDFKTHEHKFLGTNGSGSNVVFGTVSNASPLYTNGISQPGGSALPAFQNPGGTETRPRNIAFNFLVRAK